MSEPLELQGMLSKLEDKFAFAVTDLGTVFIPIAAARTKNETLLSLKDKFSYNEIIQMTVVNQQNRRNNCKYQAIKVKKIDYERTVSKLSKEVLGPLIAQVTSTTDSYAFAFNEEKGTIFVPGDAFDSNTVKNVSRYVSSADQLIVKIKEQIERKGCKWVAVEAVKQLDIKDDQEKEAVSTGEMKVSYGLIYEVESLMAQVLDEANAINVHCPILTFTGGARGKPTARTLFDVISAGDHVMFKAVRLSGAQYSAIEWKPIEDIAELVIPKKISTADSFVQTPTCLMTHLFRRLLEDHPEEMDKYEDILNKIPDCALPECYVLRRNRVKYSSAPWLPEEYGKLQ